MKKKISASIFIAAVTLGLLTACSWSIIDDINLEVNEAFDNYEQQGEEME